MIIEVDGKRIKTEGDVLVRYIDGLSKLFVAGEIDMLYINKDQIKNFHILKKITR